MSRLNISSDLLYDSDDIREADEVTTIAGITDNDIQTMMKSGDNINTKKKNLWAWNQWKKWLQSVNILCSLPDEVTNSTLKDLLPSFIIS